MRVGAHASLSTQCTCPLVIQLSMRTGMAKLWTVLLVTIGFTTSLLADIPASRRSQEAQARVTGSLQADIAAAGLEWGAPLYIRIFKEESILEVWVQKNDRFTLFRSYDICAYSGQLGPKLRQGDGQAPEGFYFVKPRALNPHSRFHLSFNLGYPNAYDRAHGRTGDYLMVHGDCVSIGCYAMAKNQNILASDRNQPIEEIWTLLAAAYASGQPFVRVHAFPFRLTDANLQRHQASPWYAFWKNLQEGYDAFTLTGRPPNVEVRDRRYVFNDSGR